MRVLHVTSGLSPRLGGPSTAALQMCEALARRGVTLSLYGPNLVRDGRWLSLKRPDVLDVPLDQAVATNGITVRYFETRWPHRFAFSPMMARRLRQAIPEFDLVHIHSLYLYPTLMAAHYARRFRVPYVIRPHGTLHAYLRRRHRMAKGVYGSIIERRNLDHAAAIHYTSASEMRAAASLRLRPPGVVIPLGIWPADFYMLPTPGSFRARYSHLRGQRLVVFLGRLARKKGLDLLIPAMGTVMRQLDNVHLVIAGPDDEGYGSEVHKLLVAAGISRRTTVIDMLEGSNKLELLVDADLWVLPSRTENFAVTAVEAMACGKPIIISDQVDIHDEVSSAHAGLVVPCSVERIAAAVTYLLLNPSECARMGMAARNFALTRYDWDKISNELATTYEAIIRNCTPDDRNPFIPIDEEEALANVRTS